MCKIQVMYICTAKYKFFAEAFFSSLHHFFPEEEKIVTILADDVKYISDMFENIKANKEYRRNKKIAKRELVKIMTNTLPTVNKITVKGVDVLNFVNKTIEASKNVSGEEVIKIILSNLAEVLKTNESRIVEIFTYMASLSPEDREKIISHSVINTMKDNDKDN